MNMAPHAFRSRSMFHLRSRIRTHECAVTVFVQQEICHSLSHNTSNSYWGWETSRARSNHDENTSDKNYTTSNNHSADDEDNMHDDSISNGGNGANDEQHTCEKHGARCSEQEVRAIVQNTMKKGRKGRTTMIERQQYELGSCLWLK